MHLNRKQLQGIIKFLQNQTKLKFWLPFQRALRLNTGNEKHMTVLEPFARLRNLRNNEGVF